MLRLIGLVVVAAWLPLGEVGGQSLTQELEYLRDQQQLPLTLPPPAYPKGVQVDAHEGDSLVLVELYNSTGGGSSWSNRSGWLEDPVAQWHGIALTNQGRVRQIHLRRNGLSGPLPTDLGLLTDLESLTLSENSLTGTIPSQLGNLTKLTSLQLAGNDLSGQLPPQLGLLTELNFLNLQSNSLTGTIPSELGNLTKLTKLQLNANDLSGTIPSEFGLLTELKQLWLSNNYLTGTIPSELANLTMLTRLDLLANDLSGPVPTQLGLLTELEYLHLGSNGLTGTIPSELANLTKLKWLALQSNNLSGVIPPELGNLSNLERLDLGWNGLSGEIPPEIGNLSNLNSLYLYQNDLSGSIPPQLGQLTALTNFDVSGNNLSGTIPAELGQLSELSVLSLQNNDLSGVIPKEFGQLSSLRYLRLQNNALSGPFPTELAQLEGLVLIYVHDNQLSGIVPDLTGLSQLDKVRVQDNQFLFADLLPNADLSSLEEFTYAPQDSIDTQLKCEASQYVFSTPATAQDNKYQWYRDGTSIPGQESPTLNVGASSTGQYHASITNNALQDLTLYSRKTDTSSIAPCQTRQFAYKADSLVLVELYNSTQGTSWTNKTGWLQTPVAEWLGIALNSEGRVKKIDLQANNLEGQLPKSISTLAMLDSLFLPGNHLSGPIPPELWQLKELKHLWLSRNSLSGVLPAELSQMTKLEEFAMTSNNLTGPIPPELGQLANLKYLWLSGNKLSGTIPSELQHLEMIGLNENNLSGPVPAHLGQWTNLRELWLCDNKFTGPIPPELGQLSELEILCMRGNELSGSIPDEFAQLSRLRRLWLNNSDLSGPVPDLTGLSQLSSVHIHANYFLFADLLPNASLNRLREFTYAPQDFIDTQLNCTSSEFVLTTPATAEDNEYKWYRDGTAIPNETSNALSVNRTASPAVYHATVTNDKLPDLTLVSRKRNPHDEAACPTRQFAHVGDSLALVAFYNSTGGPTTWRDRTGWLQDPVRQWLGIRLNSSGRVTGIELRSNGLSGTLPAQLGQLDSLQQLDLGAQPSNPHQISGAIPIELGQLSSLQTLDLSWSKLSGAVPSELGSLGRLKTLELDHNNLSGPIPPELGNLSQMERLRLNDNDFSGRIPPKLGELNLLQELLLHNNNLSGPIPPELGQLRELKGLYLYRNNLSGTLPTELGQLHELRVLYLSHNNLSGALPIELAQMVELTGMYLDDNDFSEAIPSQLGQLAKLDILFLSSNNFSEAIPNQLGQLTELETLYLDFNDFSGPIPPELGDLSRLKQMALQNNDLSGSVPPELGALSQLELLYLNNNNLSGPIPAYPGQWANLTRLWLQGNDFTGPIPPTLGQLSELESLRLGDNELSGSIPEELAQLSKLNTLQFHRNQLSGPLPDLTGLSRLEDVSVQQNQFLFADLLPNAELSGIPEFTYAPQDTINTQLTCSTSEYVLTTPATADGNQYQWHRNNEAIPGADSDTLRLTTASDLDEFHATITNEALPDLTLTSHRVRAGGASGCTTQQYANAADSSLLVDFFNRTHGSLLWHTHTGWLEEPVSQWYGITLDASGRVTEVNLPNNNLIGQLPLSQLDQLPHLSYLDVSGNEFSGTIPKGLGELTQLEYLDLSRNTLAGELPKELAGQAPLKMLNVSGNQLVGAIPTEFSQISTLQTFSVSANQLSGPVPAFTGLDQLDTLHVAQNAFLFMDLLPNASLTRLDDFVYAPQDSVETLLTRTASGFALTTAAKAAGNRYQWYRDDQPISGPQSDTLQVSATSDPAQYYATITNDRLPDLTLVSRKKGVHDGLTLTEGELPQEFHLHQSYPNPFAEATTVAFELGTPEHVRIVVYDLLGKAVATIADGRFAAGVHRVEFTCDHLASGQYMYRMEAGAYQATRFMSVVR